MATTDFLMLVFWSFRRGHATRITIRRNGEMVKRKDSESPCRAVDHRRTDTAGTGPDYYSQIPSHSCLLLFVSFFSFFFNSEDEEEEEEEKHTLERVERNLHHFPPLCLPSLLSCPVLSLPLVPLNISFLFPSSFSS